MERTTDEIVERINFLRQDDFADFFGFARGDLAEDLGAGDLERCGFTTNPDHQPKARDADSVRAQIADYMPFAWTKANDCRGLSAGRSLNHMSAWLWMLREDEAAAKLNDYMYYGKPQLRAICERFDIDWRALDDGKWRNDSDEDGAAADDVFAIELPWRPR